jgi:hypothetical protein
MAADPKSLWLAQTPEPDPMTLEQVHALARKFDRKAQRFALLVVLVLIVASFIAGQQWQIFHDPLHRAAVALYVAGFALSGWLRWKVVSPRRDPAEPAGVYLRRRLQRAVANLRGGWVLIIAPLAPSILLTSYLAVVQVHGPLWAKVLPVVVLAALAVFIVARLRRQAPRIHAELEEIEELLNR